MKKNDLMVIVSSRKGHPSYHSGLEKLPYYLSKYFTSNSFIMLYPQQLDRGIKMDDVQYVDSSLVETVSKVGLIGKLFGRR